MIENFDFGGRGEKGWNSWKASIEECELSCEQCGQSSAWGLSLAILIDVSDIWMDRNKCQQKGKRMFACLIYSSMCTEIWSRMLPRIYCKANVYIKIEKKSFSRIQIWSSLLAFLCSKIQKNTLTTLLVLSASNPNSIIVIASTSMIDKFTESGRFGGSELRRIIDRAWLLDGYGDEWQRGNFPRPRQRHFHSSALKFGSNNRNLSTR